MAEHGAARGGGRRQEVAAAERTLVFESDWAASEPFFYNVRTGRSGRCINEVIDFAGLEVDAQGFYDYLDFGFSVDERTPVRDVRFLRFASRLWRDAGGRLSVEYLDDPVPALLGRPTSEADVLEMVRELVRGWERSVAGPIVLPLSGGYDSRLLAVSLADRDRVRTFTYGTTDDQSRSDDVVKAQFLAGLLGMSWQRVPIGRFHGHLDEWDALYGPFTHAHGMYQLEFFRAVRGIMGGPSPVLSGCTGDAFAGSDDVALSMIGAAVRDGEAVARCLRETSRVGICADAAQSLLPHGEPAWRRMWAHRPELRGDLRLRVLESQRTYLALLTYLVGVPRALGFEVGAPFLDLALVAAMLDLPPARRVRRRWLRDYFDRAGMDLEALGVRGERTLTLNLQGMRLEPLRPLDEGVLREVVDPSYVRWIDRNVGPLGRGWEWYWRLGRRRGFRRAVKLLTRAGLREQRHAAYTAYLVLRPIESMLRKRDAARAGELLPAPGAGEREGRT